MCLWGIVPNSPVGMILYVAIPIAFLLLISYLPDLIKKAKHLIKKENQKNSTKR